VENKIRSCTNTLANAVPDGTCADPLEAIRVEVEVEVKAKPMPTAHL